MKENSVKENRVMSAVSSVEGEGVLIELLSRREDYLVSVLSIWLLFHSYYVTQLSDSPLK